MLRSFGVISAQVSTNLNIVDWGKMVKLGLHRMSRVKNLDKFCLNLQSRYCSR